MTLGLLLAALAVAALILFAARFWWFPAAISGQAVQYDHQFDSTLLVCGALFLLAHVLLAMLVLRSRRVRPPGAALWAGRKVEILWTLSVAALFLALAITGQQVRAVTKSAGGGGEPIRIDVLSQQFAWNFRYPGPDGKFGRTDAKFVDDAAANPFGIDRADAAGEDDRVTNMLRVPVDTPVVLILRSRDVIHSFFVRELRIKQDLVPGMAIPLQIQAARTGQWEIACAELCGLGHHQMRSVLEVMPKDEFERWHREGVQAK